MEKKELDETNGASSPAVGKPEGDAFAVQDEDWEKQSRGVKSLNDGPELCNEQDDTSENRISSQAVEKVEGDAFSNPNEDQSESTEVKIQNIGHDGLEFDNVQEDVSDRVSSHAVGKPEGDAFAVQDEDWEKQSKGVKSLNDGPELCNEQDDTSENRISSQAVEKVEGDAFSNPNEDQSESTEVKIQNIGHDGLEFDNVQEDVSDRVSSHAVGKPEGDAFAVQDEDWEKQSKGVKSLNDGPELCNEQDDTSENKISSQAVEKVEGDAFSNPNEDQSESTEVKIQNIGHDGLEFDNVQEDVSDRVSSHAVGKLEGDAFTLQNEERDKESKDVEIQHVGHEGPGYDKEPDDLADKMYEVIDVHSITYEEVKDNMTGESELAQRVDESRDLQRGPQEENLEASSSTVPGELFHEVHESNSLKSEIQANNGGKEYSSAGANMDNCGDFEAKSQEVYLNNNFTHDDLGKENDNSRSMDSTQKNQMTDNTSNVDRNSEPVFDGKEVLGVEASQETSTHPLDADPGTPRMVERALALKNFVRVKSAAAVSTMLQRFSGKMDDASVCNSDDVGKDVSDLSKESEPKNVDVENKTDQREEPITEGPPKPIAMKGRVILYTRLGCQESKEVRQFLYMKRLRYVEINIDVYPSRKMELEKISGSTSVPKVFFNEILIGGLTELKTLNESGKLDEKIGLLITEAPSFEGPFPPLSGEDDMSSSGALDEMALIVRKMKESIIVKDRFSKMRRFTNCFLGSEAVDFLSEDQYLERKEAVEFGRKLASKLFFQHVLDENLFEDGNHLYRFLDDDPIVASQCHNIPRGIITVKPKPITEIASRLRFLSYAMFEAYASEDGRHIDYRSMHGSEEFARYLRVAEELQRVEILDISREERLAFFINLYNMMTIHAILVWGHPAGALERRKLFGDFKYVISGSTYSLSAIQNGILRANQRPPYSLMKQFGAKDKRARVALSFPEPLIHFALVCGTRSGPALRCYSPGDIDKELMDAARNFLRSGGLVIDFTSKVAHASKILKWFSVDFGKNEVEVLKHVSNYLDPADLQLLLDLLATSELKVIYQPYDWGLNC